MGLKDYLKGKKRALEDYKAKHDVENYKKLKSVELKEKLDRDALRVDAERARVELKELKSIEKDKRYIKELQDYKAGGKPQGGWRKGVEDVRGAFSELGKSMNEFSGAFGGDNMVKGSKRVGEFEGMFGSGGKSDDNVFGGSTGEFNSVFGGSGVGRKSSKMKRKSKSRRKGKKTKKRGGKTITIKVG